MTGNRPSHIVSGRIIHNYIDKGSNCPFFISHIVARMTEKGIRFYLTFTSLFILDICVLLTVLLCCYMSIIVCF